MADHSLKLLRDEEKALSKQVEYLTDAVELYRKLEAENVSDRAQAEWRLKEIREAISRLEPV